MLITTSLKIITINNINLIRIPHELSKPLPSRGLVMVNAIINNFEFQTALEPDGIKGHWMLVDDQLLKSIKSKPGDTVKAQLQSTKDWIEPIIPPDLNAALTQNTTIKALWDSISSMARWEWIRWVNSTRNPSTRLKRIDVGISKLLNGSKRPCCFNGSECTVIEVSKNGVLLGE